MIKFIIKRDKMVFLVENSIDDPKDYLEFSLCRKYDRGDQKALFIQLTSVEINMLIFNLNSWLIEREVIK